MVSSTVGAQPTLGNRQSAAGWHWLCQCFSKISELGNWVTPILESVLCSSKSHLWRRRLGSEASCAFGTQIQESGLHFFAPMSWCHPGWVTPILESVLRSSKRHLWRRRLGSEASCAFGTQIQESGLPLFAPMSWCHPGWVTPILESVLRSSKRHLWRRRLGSEALCLRPPDSRIWATLFRSNVVVSSWLGNTDS